MKVCSVSQSFYPYVGGVTRYLLALGKKLVERGDDMVVVHLKAPDTPEEETIEGIKVYRLGESELLQDSMEGYLKFKEMIIDITHGSLIKSIHIEDRNTYGYPEYLGFNISMYEKVKKVYELEKFDILHVHDFQVMPLAFLLKGEIDVPVVFTWHIPFTGIVPPEWRDFLVRYMSYYDKVIFSTDEYVRTAIDSGLDQKKVCKINPFIETEEYIRPGINTFREKYGINKNDHVILCVARIDPRKGQEFLIKAMKSVLEKYPDSTCVFIGNGSLTKKLAGRKNRLEELQYMAEELGINDKVKFLGKVGQEDLLCAYDECDMLVLPSVNEGFGLVLSEAMCYNKPLIGSNIGGIPEQIVDGYNGYLFKPGDHKELSNCIISLIEDPELREIMGKRGREMACRKFCVKRGFEDHIDIYDNIFLQKRIKEKADTGESLLTE